MFVEIRLVGAELRSPTKPDLHEHKVAVGELVAWWRAAEPLRRHQATSSPTATLFRLEESICWGRRPPAAFDPNNYFLLFETYFVWGGREGAKLRFPSLAPDKVSFE